MLFTKVIFSNTWRISGQDGNSLFDCEVIKEFVIDSAYIKESTPAIKVPRLLAFAAFTESGLLIFPSRSECIQEVISFGRVDEISKFDGT